MPKKQRLDKYLAENNLASGRKAAKAAIMAGLVSVNGIQVIKPDFAVGDEKVEVAAHSKYVSRAAFKLKKAIEEFGLSVGGKKVLDIGAGSGGFSQVVLEEGARKVVAIDVGYGQYDWKLRNDSRVMLIERTNVRYLDPKRIGPAADAAVIDLSFISVRKVIENLKKMLQKNADIIILIKPQFEAEKGQVPKGGVIKDKQTHISVLESFIGDMEKEGAHIQDLNYSPIAGTKGNIEFLGYFSLGKSPKAVKVKETVENAYEELYGD